MIKKLLTTTAICLTLATSAIAEVGNYFTGANGGIRYIDNQTVNSDGSTTFEVRTVRANGTVKIKTFTVSADGSVSGNGKAAFKEFLRTNAQVTTPEITQNRIAFDAFYDRDGYRESNPGYDETQASLDWVGVTERLGIEVDYSAIQVLPTFLQDVDLTEGEASDSFFNENRYNINKVDNGWYYTENVSAYDVANVPGLEEAHAAGWTGKGTKVVIQDYHNGYHGPAVTSQFEMIAPEAEVFRADAGSSAWTYDGSVDPSEVVAVNQSYGRHLRTATAAQIARWRSDVVNLNYEVSRAPNALFVRAAGNDGYTSNGNNPNPNNCDIEGNRFTASSCGTPALIDDAENLFTFYNNNYGTDYEINLDRVIWVGATNGEDDLAVYSMSAGEKIMNSFIVADGRDADDNRGTSLAAPRVTGAISLLAQKFPNTTALQRKDIILNTADDLGAPGVDPVFGHGRLNVGAALSPMGQIN